MKPVITIIIGWTLIAFAGAGFVGWRMHVIRRRIVAHVSIVHDRSASHPGCTGVQGIAERALRDDASPGSLLTVLATGDESTANEPLRVGQYANPKTRKVADGGGADARRKQEVAQSVKRACEELAVAMVSPIFQSAKQAIEGMRQEGCGGDSRCMLWVDTDGEENAVPAIRRALQHPERAPQDLPAPLANEGIAVTFCGLALTEGRIKDPSGREVRRAARRSPAYDDNLRRTWVRLFAKPELVSFEPYCPAPSTQLRDGR
jgi:hypothetical protein